MSWANVESFATPRFTPGGAGLAGPGMFDLGFLSTRDVVTLGVTDRRSLELSPLHGGSREHPQLLRIVDPPGNRVYTAELRSPIGWDRGFGTPRVVVHKMWSLYSAGQDGWRWCKNCDGIVYAGTTICASGGVHEFGQDPADYSLAGGPGAPAGQDGWRWCKKCSSLYFAARTNGFCPAGGGHDGSASGNYVLRIADGIWRWCRKCQALVEPGGTTANCPGGGEHDTGGSGHYVLDTTTGAGRQAKWRRCVKCASLYYAGFGRCSNGPVHDIGGGPDFSMFSEADLPAGQRDWKFCRKCYSIAFNPEGREPGRCAAGGQHDHSVSLAYVAIQDQEIAASQPDWTNCNRCAGLIAKIAGRDPGSCPGGGSHQLNQGVAFLVPTDRAGVAGRPGFHWCRRCDALVSGTNPGGCQAGGNHDTTASLTYTVRTDPAAPAMEHATWRLCRNCHVLYTLPTTDPNGVMPTCSVGGQHVPTGEYFLYRADLAPNTRWCRNCESMVLADPNRPAKPCPGGREHDTSASTVYAVPRYDKETRQLVADRLTAGSSWTDDRGVVAITVDRLDEQSASLRVHGP